MHRLADHNEDYALFQTNWVGVQAKQLQREGSLCGCPEPLVIGETLDSLLGLQVLRCFRASSGPLEGIVALLESTFESQGDITRKNQRLGDPDQAEEDSRTSVPLLFEK